MLEDQSEDVRKFINKGDKIVENTLLPFPENSTTNFDTYYENTVQDDVEEGMK